MRVNLMTRATLAAASSVGADSRRNQLLIVLRATPDFATRAWMPPWASIQAFTAERKAGTIGSGISDFMRRSLGICPPLQLVTPGTGWHPCHGHTLDDMKTTDALILGCSLLLAVGLWALASRYESMGAGHVLDRWTGGVLYIGPDPEGGQRMWRIPHL
jgi:hypothetical protein